MILTLQKVMNSSLIKAILNNPEKNAKNLIEILYMF